VRFDVTEAGYYIGKVAATFERPCPSGKDGALVHARAPVAPVRCGPLWIRFIADHSPAPLRFEPPGRDHALADRIIRPPLDLSGSIVSMPSGPDASPPGRRR
jgi:hypothetical protein